MRKTTKTIDKLSQNKDYVQIKILHCKQSFHCGNLWIGIIRFIVCDYFVALPKTVAPLVSVAPPSECSTLISTVSPPGFFATVT